MTTQPTPNTELMQQNRSLPYYDGGELRSKAPRRPQSTTGGPPRAWFRSGIAVLVSVLFVGLAGINLLAQLRYSVTGRQAVGTVVEFHFSAGRSRSVTAQVDVALGDRPVFRWEVQDPFGLQAWAPAARVPLLCAHMLGLEFRAARNRVLGGPSRGESTGSLAPGRGGR